VGGAPRPIEYILWRAPLFMVAGGATQKKKIFDLFRGRGGYPSGDQLVETAGYQGGVKSTGPLKWSL